jgi:putative ABC transport system permease protein
MPTPLGHTLRRTANPTTAFTIIGVVGDVRSTALNQESPALCYPMASRVGPVMDVAVRTSGPPDLLLPVIRQKIRELDASLALANVRSMDDWLATSSAQSRLNTELLGAFASVALRDRLARRLWRARLFCEPAHPGNWSAHRVGCYARQRVASHCSRGNECRLDWDRHWAGRRVALGRTVSPLVFGVPVRDPATFVSVTVVLASVALAACAIPALRGSRVHPVVALRYE